jgi:hypothetical protein
LNLDFSPTFIFQVIKIEVSVSHPEGRPRPEGSQRMVCA